MKSLSVGLVEKVHVIANDVKTKEPVKPLNKIANILIKLPIDHSRTVEIRYDWRRRQI